MIRIKVHPHPWSESETHWCLFTERGEGGGWSGAVWFPKAHCAFNPLEGEVACPRWVFIKIFT